MTRSGRPVRSVTRRQQFDIPPGFTVNPAVNFDNNAAEREVRMVKVRQKVSGCLRTLTGTEQFCAIQSYLATAQKHDIGFFHALTTLARGQPWMPANLLTA